MWPRACSRSVHRPGPCSRTQRKVHGSQLAATGNTSAATLELFDMAGRLVHAERTSLAKGEQHTLNLEGALVQGTYSLRFTTADGRSEQRVVVR